MILLMAIAYTLAMFQGAENKKKQVQKYVFRRKETSKKYRLRSTFGMGQDGEQRANYSLSQFYEVHSRNRVSLQFSHHY